MKFPIAVVLGATIVTSTAAFAFGRSSSASRSGSLLFNVRNNYAVNCQRKMGASTAIHASPAEFAKSEIASSDVVIFSKTYCPYCTATKQLFSGMNIPAKIIELDNMDNGLEVQAALLDISGQRTVPNVFIKGKHLGGNDVSQAAARSGKLQEMLGI
ncbi:hypothetical protein ACHAW6_012682 [Cyclotella cf. meneghiniana]